MWLDVLIVVLTILIIAKGADWTVEAAIYVAHQLGVSPLIIGLTVVAMGTSAPEFAVSIIAGLQGHGDIEVGNIVGSNIFNLGFILGGCAIFRAIPTSPKLLWRDGMMLGAATLLLFGLIGPDLELDVIDGAILFSILIVYLCYLFRHRKDGEIPEADPESVFSKPFTAYLCLFGGLCMIVGGSHFLVDSASNIGRALGISEWVIAVTIVAAGTSAPEFATSLAGVLKGRYDLSAGNVIGSDLFNLLGVLGVAGMISPVHIDPMARVSLIGLCLFVFLVLVFMRSGWKIERWEGAVLVGIGLIRWALDFSARGW